MIYALLYRILTKENTCRSGQAYPNACYGLTKRLRQTLLKIQIFDGIRRATLTHALQLYFLYFASVSGMISLT